MSNLESVKVDVGSYEVLSGLVRQFDSVDGFVEGVNINDSHLSHRKNEINDILFVYFDNDITNLVSFVQQNHQIDCDVRIYGQGDCDEELYLTKDSLQFDDDGEVDGDCIHDILCNHHVEFFPESSAIDIELQKETLSLKPDCVNRSLPDLEVLLSLSCLEKIRPQRVS
jgi:hypothetical protein